MKFRITISEEPTCLEVIFSILCYIGLIAVCVEYGHELALKYIYLTIPLSLLGGIITPWLYEKFYEASSVILGFLLGIADLAIYITLSENVLLGICTGVFVILITVVIGFITFGILLLRNH